MSYIIILTHLLFQSLPTDTIKIGLLVQDKQSVTARQGAELAISEANRTSKDGKYYSLVVHHMEGPWGTGGKVSASLVFEDKVWAVIGSTDGRNAHLAEQVSAKTTVPFISAWSGDPTLAQAFIPWFFSCVPGDLQMAEVILRETNRLKSDGVYILNDDSYDSKMAVKAIERKFTSAKTSVKIIQYANPDDIKIQAAKVNSNASLVYFGTAGNLATLLHSIKDINSITIFAPYLLFTEKFPPDLKKFQNVLVLNPGSFIHNKESQFTASWLEMYGKMPGPLPAYSYDAVGLVIECIRFSGYSRTDLYKHIAGNKHQGLTGEISFDKYGNRLPLPTFIKISGDRFITLSLSLPIAIGTSPTGEAAGKDQIVPSEY